MPTVGSFPPNTVCRSGTPTVPAVVKPNANGEIAKRKPNSELDGSDAQTETASRLVDRNRWDLLGGRKSREHEHVDTQIRNHRAVEPL